MAAGRITEYRLPMFPPILVLPNFRIWSSQPARRPDPEKNFEFRNNSIIFNHLGRLRHSTTHSLAGGFFLL
jgi:hypothetical protein